MQLMEERRTTVKVQSFSRLFSFALETIIFPLYSTGRRKEKGEVMSDGNGLCRVLAIYGVVGGRETEAGSRIDVAVSRCARLCRCHGNDGE